MTGLFLLVVDALINGRLKSVAFGVLVTVAVSIGIAWFWVPIGAPEFRRRAGLAVLAFITAALIWFFALLSLLAGLVAVLLFFVAWTAGWILGWVAGVGSLKENQEPNEGESGRELEPASQS